MRRFFVSLAIGLATVAPSWAQANDEQIAQEIIEKLQSKKEAGELRGFNIDLEVDQGTVWLSGTVASPEQQRAAIEVARHVPGVEKVVNKLKIEDQGATDKAAAPRKAASPEAKPSLLGSLFAKPVTSEGQSAPRTAPTPAPTPAPSAAPAATSTSQKTDEQLVQDILARLKALKQSGQLKGFRMDVQAEDGLVWLSGNVADVAQQKVVLETVRRVPGVKQVVNDLKVKSSPTPAAAEGTGVAQTSGQMPTQATPISTPSPSLAGPPVAQPATGAPSIPGYTAIPVHVGPAPGAFAPPGVAAPMPQGVRLANRPLAFAPANGATTMPVSQVQGEAPAAEQGVPMPAHMAGPNVGIAPARYDHPNMPGYAWPSYASYPNYAAVTYPKQYSPAAWPYIGPFYPYPQVPLGWRKVTLKWDDGWWNLDFKSK